MFGEKIWVLAVATMIVAAIFLTSGCQSTPDGESLIDAGSIERVCALADTAYATYRAAGESNPAAEAAWNQLDVICSNPKTVANDPVAIIPVAVGALVTIRNAAE